MERHLLIQECEREEKMKELRKLQNDLIKKGRMVECSRVGTDIQADTTDKINCRL